MASSAPMQRQTGAAAPATMGNIGALVSKDIRLVLIGKTGAGKSASGNTILGKQVFQSLLCPRSVTSDCAKARGVVAGRSLAVVDTPGIYDTKYREDEVLRKLRMCISLSAPGPHVFLIVIKLDRFTQEELKTVELLQVVFGDKAANYSLVLFTYGDQLGEMKIEEYLSQSPELRNLIAKCNGHYHVFNNKVPNHYQVPGLLAKIDRLIRKNGGTFYTNEMFKEAEKAIQEQTRSIMMANAEQKRKEEEKLRAKLQGQTLQIKQKLLEQEFERKAREKAERKNRFIEGGLALTGAELGATIGAAAAAAGGPVCMGIAAVGGGVIGAVVGALSPRAVIALKNKCTMQ